jgi:hypothetical protein
MIRACSLAFFSLLLARGAHAKEVAGVNLPETTKVGDKTLKLNGMGLRTQTLFNVKVYVLGLYLEKTSKDAAQVISSDQVKRARLSFLYNVDRAKVGKTISTGFEKNVKDQLPVLKPRLEKLLTLIPDLKEHDQLEVTYQPGKGTAVSVNGTEKGVIEGKDFAGALFSVWLGRNPVDEDLKSALLGG